MHHDHRLFTREDMYRLRSMTPTKAEQKEMQANGGVWIEHDPSVPIHTDFHYSDARFRNHAEWTIFGRPLPEGKGGAYAYSDRLRANVGKHRDSWAAAAEQTGYHRIRSANFFSSYLSHHLGVPTVVHHILTGIDPEGYAYQVFGYTNPGQE